jgi:hypothetical protein
MTRAARAVLLAVPETAWAPDDAVPGAIPAANALGDFLARRFAATTIARVTPEAGPVTKAAVFDAFARARPAPGELFVVLFYGHGLPASADHPYQGWALSTEELTDRELAAQLHRLPRGVDTIVLSDCCYGRGIHTAGPRGGVMGAPVALAADAQRRQLWQLSEAFSLRLRAVASAPMVCISAAGHSAHRGAVLQAVAAQLVTEVTSAAERGLSYRDLEEKFRREQFAGREFYVDARPADRMEHLVLDTQVLPCAA